MSNLRDKILATVDVQSEVISIPEWDVQVEVRGLSAEGRANLLERAINSETKSLVISKAFPILAVSCSFDPETGEQLFSDEDIPALQQKNGKAIERIVELAMKLSGLSENAVDEAGKSS